VKIIVIGTGSQRQTRSNEERRSRNPCTPLCFWAIQTGTKVRIGCQDIQDQNLRKAWMLLVNSVHEFYDKKPGENQPNVIPGTSFSIAAIILM